jgi:excisionase family DNA binding protein
MADGHLTLKEAAENLGVHYMTVYRYVRTGRLPAEQVAGEWQVNPDDLAPLGRAAPGQARSPAVRTGPGPWPLRLEARLVAGDEAGAWAILESVLAAGMKPDELLLDLIAPAMRSVGTKWRSGKCSIADEHRATAVTTRLIARLGSRFARRGVKRGTVVLAAPAGELHALPVAIGANLLRWRGFHVVELGADTPAEALAEAVVKENLGNARKMRTGTHPADRQGALAVGIVGTTSGNDGSVQKSIAELRRSSPDVPALLGGAAMAGAARARRLGADVCTGARADELVRAVETIAGKRR